MLQAELEKYKLMTKNDELKATVAKMEQNQQKQNIEKGEENGKDGKIKGEN